MLLLLWLRDLDDTRLPWEPRRATLVHRDAQSDNGVQSTEGARATQALTNEIAVCGARPGRMQTERDHMIGRMAVRVSGFVLMLLLPAFLASGQDNRGSTPVFQETDPYEKPDLKEPSMWHRPSADTPAAQLALANRYAQEGRRRRAISANRSLVHKWHTSPEAVSAQQNLARLIEEAGDFEDAFLEYQYLITYFAGQFPFLEILDRQYRCANAFASRDHRFLGLALSSQRDTRQMYERLLRNGPNWAKAPEVATRIGELYEADGDVPEAIAAYDQVPNRFPNTEAAHAAAYRAATCRSHFALTHPRDAQARQDAVTAIQACLKKYPQDPQAPTLRASLQDLEGQTVEAAYAQAVFYDRNRHDRAAAIAAYRDFQRRFPDVPQAKEAAARLQLLERKPMPMPKQGVTNEVVR